MARTSYTVLCINLDLVGLGRLSIAWAVGRGPTRFRGSALLSLVTLLLVGPLSIGCGEDQGSVLIGRGDRAQRSAPPWLAADIAARLNESVAEVSDWPASRRNTRAGHTWVIRGPAFTCLADERTDSFACGTEGLVKRKGLVLGLFDPPRGAQGRPRNFRVLGLPPQSSRWLIAELGDTRMRVAVQSRPFGLAAERPIRVLGFES